MPFVGGGGGVSRPEVETIVEEKILADFANPETPIGALLNPAQLPGFIGATQANGYGTSYNVTLPAHAAGTHLIAFADRGDAGDGAPLNVPANWENVASAGGFRLLQQTAPDNATALTVTASASAYLSMVMLAYDKVASSALEVPPITGTTVPARTTERQRLVFLVEGQGTVVTDPTLPGLVKRMTAVKTNFAQAVAYDYVPTDGVVPEIVFPNATRIAVLGLSGTRI